MRHQSNASERPCIDPRGKCNHPLGCESDGDLPEPNSTETLRYSVTTCRESGPCTSQLIGTCQHLSVWVVRNDLMARGFAMEPCPELDYDTTMTNMVCHHVLVMN